MYLYATRTLALLNTLFGGGISDIQYQRLPENFWLSLLLM